MCFFCTLNSTTKENFLGAHSQLGNYAPDDLGHITKDFRTYGSKWGESQTLETEGGQITYSFAKENFSGQFSNFDAFITRPDFQQEINVSMADWEIVSNLRFVLSEDSRDVDIRIGWKNIDGANGVLGQTTVPTSGPLSDVIITLDLAEDWFVGGDSPTGQIDFSSTVTHEIGHAIGIDHSENGAALMNGLYSSTIFTIQQDDIDAVVSIYGQKGFEREDVYRFFKPDVGGHLFTVDTLEKDAVENNPVFTSEGVGFEVITQSNIDIDDTLPVYRFFNTKLGSHLFTAFETEKEHVMALSDFVFEGISFRAFSTDSAATIPVHRFFNFDSGGHFFTADEAEKAAVLAIPQMRYEGEAFFAFPDIPA